MNSDDLEKLRSLIQKLPRSEQVQVQAQFAFRTTPSLSLRVEQALLKVVSGNEYGFTPRLGVFSKKDIIDHNMFKSRLGFIPYVGIKTDSDIGKSQFPDASIFSFHDRAHWEIMHKYSPKLVEACLELIQITLKMNGNIVTDELWRVADFAFSEFDFNDKETPAQTFREFFDRFLLCYNSKTDLFKWNMILHIHSQGDRWKTDYEIDIDTIPRLMNWSKLAKIAEPFLKHHSFFEKIYTLQLLHENLNNQAWGFCNGDTHEYRPVCLLERCELSENIVEKIKEFIETQPPLPKLEIYLPHLLDKKEKPSMFLLSVEEISRKIKSDLKWIPKRSTRDRRINTLQS